MGMLIPLSNTMMSIWNVVARQDFKCFDEIMEIPNALENETVIKTYEVYTVIGPYVSETKHLETSVF